MKAKIMAIFLAVLALLSMATLVSASDNKDYQMDVEVNGFDTNGVVFVERGETLDVDVDLRVLDLAADQDDWTGVDDLRIVAWISGYDEDIEAKTSQFDVKLEDLDTKRSFHLELDLANDMDTDENYFVHVELRNHKGVLADEDAELRVSESRDLVDVMDVIVSPSNNLQAGDTFFTEVRVENMGQRDYDDVKVEVEVVGTGVSARTYIADLAAVEEDSEDDETSASTRQMMLRLPTDLATGEYELLVTVSYNRGRDQATWTETLNIEGTEKTGDVSDELKAIITVDSTTQALVQGEEGSFKLMFANLGDEKQTYTIKALGTQLWGAVRTEPAFVTVEAGETAEMYVHLTAHDDAQAGKYTFTLQIKEGNQLVKEVNLGASVTEKTAADKAAGELLSGSALRLGFVGLVVLLVIIGLVIAFKKLKDDDDYPLEPKDGKTYY